MNLDTLIRAFESDLITLQIKIDNLEQPSPLPREWRPERRTIELERHLARLTAVQAERRYIAHRLQAVRTRRFFQRILFWRHQS